MCLKNIIPLAVSLFGRSGRYPVDSANTAENVHGEIFPYVHPSSSVNKFIRQTVYFVPKQTFFDYVMKKYY